MPDIDKPRQLTLVNSDGTRSEFPISHAEALQYAFLAAKAFSVTQDSILVVFNKDLAKADVAESENTAAAKAAAKKAAADTKKLAKVSRNSTAVAAETPEGT